MIIYHENRTYHMTLAIIAHNERDIVLGTDTLWHNYLPDGKIEYTYAKKITPMNKRTALVYTGKFDGYMLQFVKTFIELRKASTDIHELREEFMYSAALPSLHEGHDVQFCFVGYIDGKPSIKAVHFEHGKDPRPFVSDHIFFPTGFDTPAMRAKELLEGKDISDDMRTAELKQTVTDVLTQCIAEYKNDENEKLGGNPDIHILRLK